MPENLLRAGGGAGPSLYRRIQSSSLLAVLAGYAFLLVSNLVLSRYQRYEAHLQQTLAVERCLEAQMAGSFGQPSVPSRCVGTSNLQVQLLSKDSVSASHTDFQHSSDGRAWLVSRVDVQGNRGRVWPVIVRENVTASVQREWLSQMLLIVLAGVSSLVTSALLRPVLNRGLVQPLREFSDQLDATWVPPDCTHPLQDPRQPVELRRITDSFNQLRLRLVASWQRERSFVDGAAHELRTPITLISGHAQNLQRYSLNPEVLRSASLIEVEAQRMSSLIGAFLELARQDSGRLKVCCSVLDPIEQLLLAYERLQPRSNNRLRIDGSCLSEEFPSVICDADRLQQCFAALVENALLYSPATKIVLLSVGREDDWVTFHVADAGPGVPLSERLTIFERFHRGSGAVNVRGSGLGLAIVQQLMNAMGGSVDVADSSMGGADFRMSLPLKP